MIILKKEYLRPELSVIHFSFRDVILTSPEDISSHLNGGDVPDDPIIEEPDDPINW